MRFRYTRMPAPARGAMAVAAVLAAGASTYAMADDYDVNSILVDRLTKAGAIPQIYQKQYGGAMPRGMPVAAIFAGDVGGRGVAFGNIQPMVRPTILKSERVVNCNDQTITKLFSVQSTTADSSTLQNSDTVSNTHKASVNVKVKTPFNIAGTEASAGYEFTHALSTTTQQADTQSKTISWSDSLNVPVGSGKSILMQYVVTERAAENVPFTANLVLSGATEIEFGGGAGAGFRWLPKQGSDVPANAIRAGSENMQTPVLCRVSANGTYYFGKGFGGRCYYNAGYTDGRRAPSTDDNYEVLTGNQQSFRWGDPNQYPDQIFDAGNSRRICFAMWSVNRAVDSIPGYVQGSNCMIVAPNGNSHIQAPNSNFYVILNPVPNRSTIRLEDYLPNERDRTIDLRGYYKANIAVDGDFRTGSAQPADCRPLKAAGGPDAMPRSATADEPGVSVIPSPDPLLPPEAIVKGTARPRS